MPGARIRQIPLLFNAQRQAGRKRIHSFYVWELGVGELGVGELGAGELGAGELGAGELGAGELGAGELDIRNLARKIIVKLCNRAAQKASHAESWPRKKPGSEYTGQSVGWRATSVQQARQIRRAVRAC